MLFRLSFIGNQIPCHPATMAFELTWKIRFKGNKEQYHAWKLVLSLNVVLTCVLCFFT